MSFSERLQELANALKLEDQELAQAGGLTKSTFSSYKTGKALPRFETLRLWSERLNVSLDWLMLGEGEMFRSSEQAAPATVSSDPIAQRVEVVAREMRAAGATPEQVRDAICRALDGRPELHGRYGQATEEGRAGFGRAAEEEQRYPAQEKEKA